MAKNDVREMLEARLEAMPMTAAKQLAIAVLAGAKLDAIDEEVVHDLIADPDHPDAAEEEAEARLLAQRGDAPGLGVLFEQVTDDVDASWTETAALFAQLCKLDDASADVRAIAVLLSGRSWPDVVARASALGAKDRLGRLAQAAVALRIEGEQPLAFLREEAARFFASLHESTTDTAALAAVGLLRRQDPPTIAALTEAVRARSPHGPAGRALIGLMGPEPAFGPPLEALVLANFGRPAEGEPVAYAALLARAAPERARALAAAPNDSPDRRAAILAARLVADRDDERLNDEARRVLDALDPMDEREAASALALLRVVHETGISAFASAAARWRAAGRSKHVGAALARWFEQHGAELG